MPVSAAAVEAVAAAVRLRDAGSTAGRRCGGSVAPDLRRSGAPERIRGAGGGEEAPPPPPPSGCFFSFSLFFII